MAPIGLGIQLWAQNTDWPSYLAAAKLVDELGYDHLWTWDHLVSAVGDPDRPVFEGYTALAAWAGEANYESRLSPGGIDRRVLEALRAASDDAP